MKEIVLFALSFVLIHLGQCKQNRHLFHSYVKLFNKTYIADKAEYDRRYEVFVQNLEIQKDLNSRRTSNASAWYGPTQFSDLTDKEFAEMYLSSYSHKPDVFVDHKYQGGLLFAELVKIPTRVDWRDKKIVTPVRNQGSCGGCWAFAIVEAIESMSALKSGKLESLSVQEVLDCSYNYSFKSVHLYSCKGGDTCTALEWLKESKAHITTEKKYPLKDKPETCHIDPKTAAGVQLQNYTCVNYVNYEHLLLNQLATVGPVAVSVDATTWNNYQGGIIQYHCGGTVGNNHAVTIVGYDLTGDIPYYIVKNSWGSKFGQNGYLYVKVGDNVCGIVNEVSTVTV